MGDDWEENDTYVTPPPPAMVGKSFGGRGRGFVPQSIGDRGPKSFNDNDKGFKSRSNDGFGRRNDGENGGGGGFRKPRRDNDGEDSGFRKPRRDNDGDGEEGENGAEPEKPKRQTYVPEEPTEDESEMFSSGISTGINFDKYDDIEVKVSGENYPDALKAGFEHAGLRNQLLENIKRCNYLKPTPIQRHAIPIILAKRDLMSCAQTGSGKTAAFLIPIIQTLLSEPTEHNYGECSEPQVVIVSPTRELTCQIFEEARKFAHQTILKVNVVYGGTMVGAQLNRLSKGCHILVATPGRLSDFVNRGKISYSSVRFVVLDEADRMLDMGFLSNIREMMEHPTMAPKEERQTLMFSATFPEEIQRLAQEFLTDYIFVAVGEVGSACSDVEQKFYKVGKFEKREKLHEVVTAHGSDHTMVFVEQKRTCDMIATYLSECSIRATSIHGDREQREREVALSDFRRGKMDVLVATSVAARGLDIKNVRHVINFDLPKDIDEYVHRIGRTGRVGNKGLSTAFYNPEENRSLACGLVKILKQAKQEVPEFLLEESSGGGGDGGEYGRRGGFGGRDFRSRGDDSGSAPAPAAAPAEEEDWG